MIRGLLLDHAGVLADTPATGWQARWEARLGLAAGTVDARLADVYRAGTTGAIDVAGAVRAIEAALGTGEGRAIFDAIVAEQRGIPNASLVRLVATLRPRLRIGLLSNSWLGAREAQADLVAGLVDVAIYSHEEGLVKPAPEIYARACAALGVPPGETLFLDDLRANIAGARASGLRAHHVTDSASAAAELARLLDEDGDATHVS